MPLKVAQSILKIFRKMNRKTQDIPTQVFFVEFYQIF